MSQEMTVIKAKVHFTRHDCNKGQSSCYKTSPKTKVHVTKHDCNKGQSSCHKP